MNERTDDGVIVNWATEHVNARMRATVDAETGEVRTWERTDTKAGAVWRPAYDQDAADLERWMLQGYARRLLWSFEDRDARRRVPFTEIAPASDVCSRRLYWAPVAERYKLELEPVPAFTRLEDRAMISARQKRAAVYRVVNCSRDKIGNNVAPEIWYSKESERASFHKVGVCGSVWTCLICSRRINLGRQREIAAAYDLFVGSKSQLRPGVRNGDAMLVTLTLRHGVGDDLGTLLDGLKLADRTAQKSYGYKRLVGYKRTVNKTRVSVPSEVAYVGRISATELTYGKNGWHPHLHQLWFFDRRLTAQEVERIRADLFEAWSVACVKVGLPAPLEFSKGGRALGVDVRRALSAEEYLTKFAHGRQWAPEREMASQHSKKGRGGRTAFQLLADYAQGDREAGALFRIFAGATLGRHQLQWSRGLLERLRELGFDDVLASDEELAASRDDGAALLGELGDAEWTALVDASRFGIEAHGATLAIAKHSGFEAAVAFLRGLPSFPASAALDREIDEARLMVSAAKAGRLRYECLRTDLPETAAVLELDHAAAAALEIPDVRVQVRAWATLERHALALLRDLP